MRIIIRFGAAMLVMAGLLAGVLGAGRSVEAADDVVCGDAATISVTIKDAAGQPVSDHTQVQFVTNYGGVLAGAAATLDPATLASASVTPLSSATAETFNGVATITLLTSTEHIGPYEVVATSGGSVYATTLPSAPIYAPGGTTPNVASTFPRPSYGLVYVPAAAPISAQVTVTCHAAS